MSKKIKMFKPGKHVGTDGKTYEFSEADLKACVAAYNPTLHAAPLVIGHPKIDAPAYGRINAIEFSDGYLMGDPANVDPAFAEIVNSGKYDRVSLSFYSPTSPSNPVPGVLYPRHLGFLGATPPGCKGLGAVSFGESEEGVISFGDWEDRLVVRIFRNLKNFMIGEYGQEKADKVIDEWDLQAITEEALRPEPSSELSPQFAEPPPEKGADMQTKEQLEAREKDLNTREQVLKNAENTGKHAGNLEFAEGLVKAGKLLAVNKAALVGVLDFAAGITEGDTIEFGEGDAKKSQAPLETIKTLFSSLPRIIEFAELGGGEEPGKKQTTCPIDVSKYI